MSDGTCSERPHSDPAAAEPGRRATPGDRRFRLVLLGRFGVGRRLKVEFDLGDFIGPDSTQEIKPDATLGVDVRLEKPAGRYVTAGVALSNYWVRPTGDPNYALDVSPFVKPRYALSLGRREAEVYLIAYIGGSLISVETATDNTGNLSRGVHGGFNVGFAPGFQIFVSDTVAVLAEIGYSFSWFKISNPVLTRLTLGQATIRFGFAFAFGP